MSNLACRSFKADGFSKILKLANRAFVHDNLQRIIVNINYVMNVLPKDIADEAWETHIRAARPESPCYVSPKS